MWYTNYEIFFFPNIILVKNIPQKYFGHILDNFQPMMYNNVLTDFLHCYMVLLIKDMTTQLSKTAQKVSFFLPILVILAKKRDFGSKNGKKYNFRVPIIKNHYGRLKAYELVNCQKKFFLKLGNFASL